MGVNVQEKNRSRLVLKAPTMVEPSQAMLVPNFDIHMNKHVWVQEMVNFLRIFKVTPELNDGL